MKPVNASARCKGGYEFLTMDPAYRVKFSKKQLSAECDSMRIRISGHIETRDLYWALAKSQELVHRYRRGPLGAVARRLKK